MVSFEEYRTAVAAFLDTSDRMKDGWKHFADTTVISNFWMIHKRQTVFCQKTEIATRQIVDEKEDDVESLDEVDEEVPSEPNGIFTFDYHVIFNEAFAVPQLLFNAVRSDGSLVPLTVLHDLIPRHLSGDGHPDQRHLSVGDREGVWSTLSQIEHPILHSPVFALHPCQTNSFLQLIQTFSKQWFVSWLSSVGAAVGLRLSPQYGLSHSPQEHKQ